MAIEIVDLPIDSMVMFHSYVSLPQGKLEVPTISKAYFSGLCKGISP